MMLNPREVTFGGEAWSGVGKVSVERSAARLIEEWTDTGPHAVLVDVPEARVVVKVEQTLSEDDPGDPVPGAMGELVVEFGPSGGDLLRRRLRVAAVVVTVVQSIDVQGAKRVVTMRGVSTDGVVDPVVVEAIG